MVIFDHLMFGLPRCDATLVHYNYSVIYTNSFSKATATYTTTTNSIPPVHKHIDVEFNHSNTTLSHPNIKQITDKFCLAIDIDFKHFVYQEHTCFLHFN